MSYTDYNDKRTPEQREHDFMMKYLQGDSTSIPVNPDDINSGMWKFAWDVSLDDRSYYVAADSEGDALDEVIDFLYWHTPVYLFSDIAYPYDEVTEAMHLDQDALYAGNFGHLLRKEIVEELVITKYRKRRRVEIHEDH